MLRDAQIADADRSTDEPIAGWCRRDTGRPRRTGIGLYDEADADHRLHDAQRMTIGHIEWGNR